MGDIGPARQRFDVLPAARLRGRRRRLWTAPARMTVPSPEPMPAPHPEPDARAGSRAPARRRSPTPTPVPSSGHDSERRRRARRRGRGASSAAPSRSSARSVGLRTFRVDESGLLLPLYSERRLVRRPQHRAVRAADRATTTADRTRVPADDCECGFYAYGTPEAAAQNRQTALRPGRRLVLGRPRRRARRASGPSTPASTRSGCSPAAPAWLRQRVATRYPSARLYADADAMLAEHPLTELELLRAARAGRRAGRAGRRRCSGARRCSRSACCRSGTLHDSARRCGTPWLAVTAAPARSPRWLLVGAHGAGHFAAAFVLAGVLAWLLAPVFGLAGWLLRVPLLRGLAVAVGGYLLALRPHHFPVVRDAARAGVLRRARLTAAPASVGSRDDLVAPRPPEPRTRRSTRPPAAA